MSKYKYEVIDYNKFETFDCLSDLLHWAIQNQDSNASKQLSDYFYEIFQLYREKHNGEQALIYPDKFYSMIYITIEKIVNTDKNTLHVIEHRAISGIWILGEYSNTNKISEESYTWLWRNLVLAINKDKDDLVFEFWENSHQFYKFNFDYIQSEYEYTDNEYVIINQKEIDERNMFRSHFFEFHIALGGLLVFKRKFDLLKKIFNYTTSIPPDYVLLPKQMIEIYQSFINFFDPFDRKYSWITHKYYFPGLNGLNADREIKEWICKYIGLLFIRQLNIRSHYNNYNPQELYNLPSELAEKRLWSENIKYFKSFIDDFLKTEIKTLTLFDFDPTIDYSDKADEFEFQIKEDYNSNKLQKEPEREKVELFFETSNDILKKTFFQYKGLSNLGVLTQEEETGIFNIQGQGNVTSKDTFLEVGVHHMNYHSFLAESVSRQISEGYFQIFNANATTKFVFEQENVFEAISKMKLNPNKHIIVIFGYINIEYYIDILKIENLSRYMFNEIEMRYYSGISYGLTNSIFIIEKDSLPFVEHVKLNKEIIDLYQLDIINTEYNIYATVSDLNTNNKLRTELEKEKNLSDENLKESVWQGISFRIIIKWKKEIKMNQIHVKNAYDESRKLSDLENVNPF